MTDVGPADILTYAFYNYPNNYGVNEIKQLLYCNLLLKERVIVPESAFLSSIPLRKIILEEPDLMISGKVVPLWRKEFNNFEDVQIMLDEAKVPTRPKDEGQSAQLLDEHLKKKNRVYLEKKVDYKKNFTVILDIMAETESTNPHPTIQGNLNHILSKAKDKDGFLTSMYIYNLVEKPEYRQFKQAVRVITDTAYLINLAQVVGETTYGYIKTDFRRHQRNALNLFQNDGWMFEPKLEKNNLKSDKEKYDVKQLNSPLLEPNYLSRKLDWDFIKNLRDSEYGQQYFKTLKECIHENELKKPFFEYAAYCDDVIATHNSKSFAEERRSKKSIAVTAGCFFGFCLFPSILDIKEKQLPNIFEVGDEMLSVITMLGNEMNFKKKYRKSIEERAKNLNEKGERGEKSVARLDTTFDWSETNTS